MSARALLISLRDPDDAMAGQEQRCFADRAGLPLDRLDVHSMQSGRPDRGQLRRYDAIFFGGSGAYSVLDDLEWVRQTMGTLLDVLDERLPAYASCFGFHGLAIALGGSVVNDDARAEMGAVMLELTNEGAKDPLFSCLPGRFWAQEGHHDRVDVLPAGVTLLVSGEVCYEQAFRVNGAPFWASQFHPELTAESTAERFRHYRDHYLHPEQAASLITGIEEGRDAIEMAEVLPRLLRGDFG